MEEKKFPIYKFKADWDLEDGTRDGTSWWFMFKQDPTEDELNEVLEKHRLARVLKQENLNKSISNYISSYEFVEYESWCLHWFNHYTYNLFETDEEVEKSFYNFIDRKYYQNKVNDHYKTERKEGNNNPFYCFMGAEDHWRWKICRCEHCQKLGKITIDH